MAETTAEPHRLTSSPCRLPPFPTWRSPQRPARTAPPLLAAVPLFTFPEARLYGQGRGGGGARPAAHPPPERAGSFSPRIGLRSHRRAIKWN